MKTESILATIRRHHPGYQALYLFGSYDTEWQRPDSDVDLAMLLPPDPGAAPVTLGMSELRVELEELLHRTVDLVDLRQASTVLRHQVVTTGRRLATPDPRAADEFEMLTLSYYQALNYERREILEQFRKTGRAYEP